MISKLYKYKTIQIFLFIFFAEQLLYFFTSWIFCDIQNFSYIENDLGVTTLLIWQVLFLAPLLETLFFQYLLQYFLIKLLKFNSIFTIIIASLIFSISHELDLLGSILTFFSGISLNLLFFVVLNKDSDCNLKKAYITTAFYHFTLNLTVLSFSFVQ